MKKVVLKVEFHDGKVKQKAMKVVSGLSGVDSIAMDTGNKKLTVTGDIDPVGVVAKLRKICHTEILTVGPAKEPEKKKDDGKKDDGKKEDDKKKDSKDDAKALAYPVYPYYHPQQLAYNYQQSHVPTHYYQRSAEEDPNACVIC